MISVLNDKVFGEEKLRVTFAKPKLMADRSFFQSLTDPSLVPPVLAPPVLGYVDAEKLGQDDDKSKAPEPMYKKKQGLWKTDPHTIYVSGFPLDSIASKFAHSRWTSDWLHTHFQQVGIHKHDVNECVRSAHNETPSYVPM